MKTKLLLASLPFTAVDYLTSAVEVAAVAAEAAAAAAAAAPVAKAVAAPVAERAISLRPRLLTQYLNLALPRTEVPF